MSDNYSTWTATSSGTSAPPTDIPYMDGSYDASADYTRTSTFVMDDVRNTLAVYKGFRGDICQYLGKTQTALKGYRLPMANEFGSRTGTMVGLDGWSWGGGMIANYESYVNQYGTGNLIRDPGSPNIVYTVNSIMGIRLPMSMQRSGLGVASGAGNLSFYCTGSAGTATESWAILLQPNINIAIVNNVNESPRAKGYAVRCVKN